MTQETTLFKNLLKQVKLLKNDKVNLYQSPEKIKSLIQPSFEEKSINTPALVTSTDKIFHTNRVLPQKVLQLFKKGQYNPQDTIDLHGMTTMQAKAMLDEFIEESYQANFFIIGVIHGKGRNNMDQPILKNKVNEWLREYTHVIAYCSAPTKEGGTGKTYIMLERRR